jgi:hypothetical protein
VGYGFVGALPVPYPEEGEEVDVLCVTPVRLPVPAGFVVDLLQLPEPWGLLLVVLLVAVVTETLLVAEADALVSGCHGFVGTAIVIT